MKFVDIRYIKQKVIKFLVRRISSKLKYVQDTAMWKTISHISSYLYPISLSEHLKEVIVRACVGGPIHISASSFPSLKSKQMKGELLLETIVVSLIFSKRNLCGIIFD